MANSDWSFDAFKRPGRSNFTPSDRGVPSEPRQDRIPQPATGFDALRALFDANHPASQEPTFDPFTELVAEARVAAFVADVDTVFDCPACFAQHFSLGETCRRHDV